MKIKITVKRISNYIDLQKEYENPIIHPCSMKENMEFISIDGNIPKGMCLEAWKIMEPFIKDLNNGVNNFFDGWMKDINSCMISCNDGFRPVSFYIEVIKD